MALNANPNYGRYSEFEVAAAAVADDGDLAGLNSSGYVRRFTLGDKLVGMFDESFDNTAGINGARKIRVLRGEAGTFRLRLTLTGASLTDSINKVPVFATDHDSVSLREGQCIGYVDEYLADGDSIIVVETNAKDSIIAETIAFADLTDGGGTDGTDDLAITIPEGAVVTAVQADVKTAFDGTTPTLKVGTDGDPDAFASGLVVSAIDVVGTVSTAATSYLAADDTLRVTVTDGADFGNNTAGEVDVRIHYSNRLQVG